jgi:hypothetical protein
MRDVNISFMQSDGGLTPMTSFLGNRAILSGPAGGVVGYALTSRIPVVESAPFAVPEVVPIGAVDSAGIVKSWLSNICIKKVWLYYMLIFLIHPSKKSILDISSFNMISTAINYACILVISDSVL